ncbi:MAG: amidohydrolase family protein [Flavobacteriales bacterium]
MLRTIHITLLMICALLSNAQQNPMVAAAQTKSILLKNATAHLGNGQVIQNSMVGFREGVIDLVADATTIRMAPGRYELEIDAYGMHVYPGFIATNSTLGLLEIDMVRASNDMSETGTFKPSMRTAPAYNTDSEIIPTVRSNGILTAQITPRGGTIAGSSSVMQLDAWNWEDALIVEDEGMHMQWPGVIHRHGERGKVDVMKVKTYDQQIREIELFFNEAKAYCDAKPLLTDIRFEAMCDIFAGKRTLYIRAEDATSIREAVQFLDRMHIKTAVIVGGYESYLVADLLVQRNIPVLLRRLHEYPMYVDEDVDLPYKLPQMLHQAGVRFALQNEGDMERMGTRNLPFYAGTAVAYGLPYEQAVRSITLEPAIILGVDSMLGSIEIGKRATLFISKGDALDMRTNQVTHAFIDGRQIDLSSKQTELYERYRTKYEIQEKK